MFLAIYRAIKFALQGFWRNIWLSIVTIAILVLTMFSISVVGTVNIIGRETLKSIQNKIDVSAYFKSDVSEDQILTIKYRLENLSQVKSVNYISKEQALDNFKEKHKDDPEIIASIEELENNPLGATLVIQANNIEDYKEILNVMQDPDYSDLTQNISFEDNQDIINILTVLTDKVQKVVIIISGIFIIITILIIFNTIRITIYTHREEIGIMKLVGATNWFIRAPFLIESIIISLLACAICLAVSYPLLSVISPQIGVYFFGYIGYGFDLLNYFIANFWYIVGLELGFAIILSVISSSIAIGKYLKV